MNRISLLAVFPSLALCACSDSKDDAAGTAGLRSGPPPADAPELPVFDCPSCGETLHFADLPQRFFQFLSR